MGKYKIQIRRSAVKDLEGLSQRDRRRVVSRIRRLENDARPAASEKLSALEKYRLRVGFCRVAYQVDEEEASVSVFKIGRLRDVLDRKPFLS